MPVKVKMPIGTKLIILLYICLALNYQATQANPAGVERSTRTKNEAYDWFASILAEYGDDDSESEEILICRNCTVVVSQPNAADTTAAPATMASTPPAISAAPTAPTVAPVPTPGSVSPAPGGMTPAPGGMTPAPGDMTPAPGDMTPAPAPAAG